MDICILARKRLQWNTRIVRQAKALVEAGHRVTVVAVELPNEKLREMTSEVEYLQVDLFSLPVRVISNYNRIKRFPSQFLKNSQSMQRIKQVPRRTVNAIGAAMDRLTKQYRLSRNFIQKLFSRKQLSIREDCDPNTETFVISKVSAQTGNANVQKVRINWNGTGEYQVALYRETQIQWEYFCSNNGCCEIDLVPGAYRVKIKKAENDHGRWSKAAWFRMNENKQLWVNEKLPLRQYELDTSFPAPEAVTVTTAEEQHGHRHSLNIGIRCIPNTGLYQIALFYKQNQKWRYITTYFSHNEMELSPGRYSVKSRYLLGNEILKAGPWSEATSFTIGNDLRLFPENIDSNKNDAPAPLTAADAKKWFRRCSRYLWCRCLRPLIIAPLWFLNGNSIKELVYSHAMDDADLLRKILLPYVNHANSLDFAKKSLDILGDRKFEIVQAHDTHALPAARKLAHKSGGRFVYDALEIPDDRSGISARNEPKWLRLIEGYLEKRIIRTANVVLAVGPAVAESTAKSYGINCPEVVRNCCLYTQIEPNNRIKQTLGIDNGDRVCVVIGSIYNNQGFEQLIDSFAYLDSGIHIAALGPESEPGFISHLEGLAAASGVSSRFHILPPRPPFDLIPYASGADLGIIARQRNCLNNIFSLPNKIFELIMARLPVTCSRLPNIEKIVRQYEIGQSFNETDPQDIARAINAMLENKNRYNAYKEAVEKAAAALCWEYEGRKYVNFLEGTSLQDCVGR
jgi:glycosyltransferase involved in cell wall biosynthesis